MEIDCYNAKLNSVEIHNLDYLKHSNLTDQTNSQSYSTITLKNIASLNQSLFSNPPPQYIKCALDNCHHINFSRYAFQNNLKDIALLNCSNIEFDNDYTSMAEFQVSASNCQDCTLNVLMQNHKTKKYFLTDGINKWS
ncbi:hypothetical protein FACS1894166_13510 [Bacilli bacterium]|nr:hypothetical protein FACS1894166_13510 [Bacilli bacterium]